MLAIPFGHGIDFRRGHTHGLIAMVVLPLLLAGAMWLWQRRRNVSGFDLRATVILGAIAIFTHPFLDGMNTYGVRWLMPFSDRWYSAQSLFIIDVVMWICLGAGWWLSRRASRQGRLQPGRPAATAITVVALYVAFMIGASAITRRTADKQLGTGGPVSRMTISPRPGSIATREIIYVRDSTYRFATASLFNATVRERATSPIPINAHHPAARAAAAMQAGRQFLVWSQLPYFTVSEGTSSASVRLDDARYSSGQPSWAAVLVEVPRGADGTYSQR